MVRKGARGAAVGAGPEVQARGAGGCTSDECQLLGEMLGKRSRSKYLCRFFFLNS